MKINAGIGSEQQEITLTRDGTRVSADIAGRRYDLEIRPPANGSYLLLHEGRVYNCLVQGAATNGATVTVGVGGRDYAITLTDPKRRHAGGDKGLEVSGQLTAHMPGKVVRVLLTAGTEVEEGTAILVVEAMKMQNEMKAPRAGVIKSVNVAEGDTVNAGDVMVVIE